VALEGDDGLDVRIVASLILEDGDIDREGFFLVWANGVCHVALMVPGWSSRRAAVAHVARRGRGACTRPTRPSRAACWPPQIALVHRAVQPHPVPSCQKAIRSTGWTAARWTKAQPA
jgi:hypothetical protein